jgi:outer membrane translocation and assembly module TamA
MLRALVLIFAPGFLSLQAIAQTVLSADISEKSFAKQHHETKAGQRFPLRTQRFKYDWLTPKVRLGFNIDDGIIIGSGFTATKGNIEADGFPVQHKMVVGGGLKTASLLFKYAGVWKHSVGSYDVNLGIDGQVPSNKTNFFGIGNETQFVRTGAQPIKYYRSRYNVVNAQIALHRFLNNFWEIRFGVMGQFYEAWRVENSERILSVYDIEEPERSVFNTKVYAGALAEVAFDNQDNALLPTKGMHWFAKVSAAQEVLDEPVFSGNILSSFTFNLTPRTSKFTFVNRIGGGIVAGDPAFFQLMYLGGNSNLRGYRNFRFAGNQMLYHNLEIRREISSFTSKVFSATCGAMLFNDLGRVWAQGEKSSKVHHGYGGGLYILPRKSILFQLLVGHSAEGTIPHASLGLKF